MLNVTPGKVYIDATLGRGGHSSEILKRLKGDGLLLSFDRDDSAIKNSFPTLKAINSNFKLIHANFSELKSELLKQNINHVDGIIFDLGVSSPQLDDGNRGFSYNYDARLDMRMDKNQKLDAYYVVNNYSKERLIEIFYKYGEEQFSKKIAENIIKKRKISPIETTFQLVEIIKQSLPEFRKKQKGHPAKQVFQAIRIEVNNELEELKSALVQALDLLNKNATLSVITFHSLEDRIVKQIFNEKTKQISTPKNLVDLNQKEIEFVLVNKKPILASQEEIENNNRAHSAKLRGIRRIQKGGKKMRYVNLKKKNTVAIEVNAKRFATLSSFLLVVCSFIFLPLTKNLEKVNAKLEQETTELRNIKYDDSNNYEVSEDEFVFIEKC